MRCSSCEPLLDQYLERALSPRVMLRVAKHVHSCKACHALLHELRSVDGLLLGAKQPDLPPNFTFAVMAEVRGMPAVRRRRIPAWAVLCQLSRLRLGRGRRDNRGARRTLAGDRSGIRLADALGCVARTR